MNKFKVGDKVRFTHKTPFISVPSQTVYTVKELNKILGFYTVKLDNDAEYLEDLLELVPDLAYQFTMGMSEFKKIYQDQDFCPIDSKPLVSRKCSCVWRDVYMHGCKCGGV